MPPELVELGLGDLTITMTPAVAEALRAGELDPDVAYMQGKLKVVGDMAHFFDLLPLAASANFGRALAG